VVTSSKGDILREAGVLSKAQTLAAVQIRESKVGSIRLRRRRCGKPAACPGVCTSFIQDLSPRPLGGEGNEFTSAFGVRDSSPGIGAGVGPNGVRLRGEHRPIVVCHFRGVSAGLGLFDESLHAFVPMRIHGNRTPITIPETQKEFSHLSLLSALATNHLALTTAGLIACDGPAELW
jgi:hypothetical protein